MKMRIPVVIAAAALIVAGCDQNRDGATADSQGGVGQSKDQVERSAEQAKDEVERQAKAQKEMLDSQAKAAQAQIDAEKAKAEAATTDADAKVNQASQQIRDAAGNAGAQAQQAVGTPPPATGTDGGTSTANMDQQLTQQVQTALKNAQQDQNVQVTVSNGKATLTGTAKSDAEKQQIEASAKQVSGVTSVDNQIKVEAQ